MNKKLFKSTFETPVGEMILITSDKGLCFLEYPFDKREKLIENRIKNYFKDYQLVNNANSLKPLVLEQLNLYFNHKKTSFNKIPLDVRGSEFEKKVWSVLKTITVGDVLTYKEVAIKLGNPKASRAIGGASRRNPTSIIIPCHRVIGSSGSLTGYGGGLSNKEWLINHEKMDKI